MHGSMSHQPRSHTRGHCSRVAPLAINMGFFDNLASSFANDETLGERLNAGLVKEKDMHTITWKDPCGRMISSRVVAGQKLSDVARASGVPIKYSCMEGACRICDVCINGKRMPSCTAAAPAHDVSIEYGMPREKTAAVAAARAATDSEATAPALSLEEQLKAELASGKGGGFGGSAAPKAWPWG